MKTKLSVLALGALLSLAPTAQAQRTSAIGPRGGGGGGFHSGSSTFHAAPQSQFSSPHTFRSGSSFRPIGPRGDHGGWHGSGGWHGDRGLGWHRGGAYNRWYWYGYYPFWASLGWWWGVPYYNPYWVGYGYGGSGSVPYRTSRYASVKTDVQPDEAEVWLDGKYIGTADDFDGFPGFLYLEPGKYHVEFKLAGYQPYSTDVEVTRGECVRIDHHLDLAPGHSRLDSFTPEKKKMPAGRVYGKGGVPVTPGAGADDEGDTDRDHDRVGRYDEDDRDTPPPPARSSVRHADHARLRLKISPPDAAVYVDDRYIGTAEDLESSPRGTSTTIGSHKVSVVRPGYKSRTVDVEIKDGGPFDVVIELEK